MQQVHTHCPPTIACDFYKQSHRVQYPPGTEIIYSTWTPRSSRKEGIDKVVAFGFQGFVKKYLIDYFNEHFFWRTKEEVIEEFTQYIKYPLGIEQPDTSHFEALHDLGYLPITIKAVKEGTLVPIRVPMLTIENTLPEFFWLTNFLESLMSCEMWQPITSATLSHEYRKLLQGYALMTVGNDYDVPFLAHDFSLRGLSSLESATTSGAGHLLSFLGTDSIPAIWYHQKYYGADIENEEIGKSVAATEHSVACAYGEDELAAFRRLITEVYPSGFVSVVSDSWDFWGVIEGVIPALKDEIMARDGRLIVRPDCYDDKTQLLTNSGWKFFSDLNESDLVAQVLEDGSYEFVKPLEYIEQDYEGDMYHFFDGKDKLDLVVTPNHRMVFNQNGKIKIQLAKDAKVGAWKKDMIRSARALSKGRKLAPIERLRIAFQADGSYCTNIKSSIRFNMQKERKVERLLDIVVDADLKHSVYSLADGRTEIHIKVDASEFDKDFNWVDTSNLCSNWCEEFIEELSFWDATRRHDKRYKFDTTDKSVMDVVEIVSISAGYGVLISRRSDDRKSCFSDVYTAHIMKDNLLGGQSQYKERVDYKGKVYCVKVSSGMLLVKRNRSVVVSGNSGCPVDILCGDRIEEYDSIDDADAYIRGDVRDWASVACEGSYKHGAFEYIVPFKVSDEYYKLTAEVEYGRHDKRYYFVDMVNVVSIEEFEPSVEQLGLVESLWNIFGGTVSEKGYKVLDSHIGAIYGDSITLERAKEICERLEAKGFATTNVCLGVGSYTFQYNTRDTFGFAMKATYAVINGEERLLFKDPKTDNGVKKSQKGLVVVYEDEDGELRYKDGLTREEQLEFSNVDLLETVFSDGQLLREETLSGIRERLAANLGKEEKFADKKELQR